MSPIDIALVAAHVVGWASGAATVYLAAAHRAAVRAGLSLPDPEPSHACLAAIEQAEAGRLHASPSGRLVVIPGPAKRPLPPTILDTCPWCRVELVRRLPRGHEWVLTDAGQAHRRAVVRAEQARRSAR